MTDSAALYARYRGMLFGVAFYLTHNAADAEDLVQDTFIRALTHAVPTDHPDRWLRRICANLARDQRRRRTISTGRRGTSRTRRIRCVPWGPGTPEGVDLQTPEHALLRQEAQAEAARALAHALAPLPPGTRQVLLWALAGVPLAAIARRVGRHRSAVKSEIWRARRIAQAGRRPRMGRPPKQAAG